MATIAVPKTYEMGVKNRSQSLLQAGRMVDILCQPQVHRSRIHPSLIHARPSLLDLWQLVNEIKGLSLILTLAARTRARAAGLNPLPVRLLNRHWPDITTQD